MRNCLPQVPSMTIMIANWKIWYIPLHDTKDKWHCRGCLFVLHGCCLCPFAEIIHHGDDVHVFISIRTFCLIKALSGQFQAVIKKEVNKEI